MIFEFKVFGRTPAKLIKTIFHLDNVPAKPGTQPSEPDLPPIPEYKSPGPTTEIPEEGRIVAPGGDLKVNLWFRQQLTEEEWVKLRDGQTLMCAYGIIKYEDAFGKERETKVCYFYRFRWGGVIKAPDETVLNPSGFLIGGPAAYNKAT